MERSKLEGDPSLAYSINCFDFVLDVKGTNEEGEARLAGVDIRQLRHRPIESAVAATVEHMEKEDVPQQTEDGFRISAETGNERHSERLRQELEPLIEHLPPAPTETVGAPPAVKADDMSGALPMPQEGAFEQSGQSPQAQRPAEMMPQDRDELPTFRPNDGGVPPDMPHASSEQAPSLPPEAQDDRPGDGQALPEMPEGKI